MTDWDRACLRASLAVGACLLVQTLVELWCRR